MPKLIFIIFAIVLGQLTIINAQSISRKVIASAGGTLSSGAGQINYNIGETLIASLSAGGGNGNMITQGFEQPAESGLNLKLYLQGYYFDAGIMQPVLINQGLSALITETDTIEVQLHDAVNFNLVDSKKALLFTNGTVSVNFTQPEGTYYIAIKHRNIIQTWSATPVNCTVSTPVYDFTTAQNKAFGNNQVEVQNGKWAFFTGDLNQDDFIDGNDFPAFDTDSFNGVNSAYVATDMNGDGFVDGNDFPVFDVNSFNGVSSVYPQ